MKFHPSLYLFVSLMLTGCLGNVKSHHYPSTSPDPRIQDSGPAVEMDVSHIPDAVPRVEPIKAAGNKSPYTVLGKTYVINFNNVGFVQEGIASWYGKKFHGRKTANGEVYDMYGMTAAHTTLPIPTFLRVTNIENGRVAIVRVNDRGPFHQNRILDLSYTAAKKLDYHRKGTARVRIEVIDPNQNTPAPIVNTLGAGGQKRAPMPTDAAGYALPGNTHLQVGAFGKVDGAYKLANQIRGLIQHRVFVDPPTAGFYKVFVGPITNNLMLYELRDVLQQNKLPYGHTVEK